MPEDDSDLAADILGQFRSGDVTLIAPDLLLTEFGHSLAKRTRPTWTKGPPITVEEAFEIFEAFLTIGIGFFRTNELAAEALRLATRFQAGLYDATFVALARACGVNVVTFDSGMGTAFGPLACAEVLTSH